MFSEVLWVVKKHAVVHQVFTLCRNVSHATKAVCTPAWLDVYSSTGETHSFSFNRHMSLRMMEHTSCLSSHQPIDTTLVRWANVYILHDRNPFLIRCWHGRCALSNFFLQKSVASFLIKNKFWTGLLEVLQNNLLENLWINGGKKLNSVFYYLPGRQRAPWVYIRMKLSLW